MKIAEAYPELVKSITLAKDCYSPIVLAGVVKGESNISTNLLCVIEFHLPYLTKDNSPTSLKIAVDRLSVRVSNHFQKNQRSKLFG